MVIKVSGTKQPPPPPSVPQWQLSIPELGFGAAPEQLVEETWLPEVFWHCHSQCVEHWLNPDGEHPKVVSLTHEYEDDFTLLQLSVVPPPEPLQSQRSWVAVLLVLSTVPFTQVFLLLPHWPLTALALVQLLSVPPFLPVQVHLYSVDESVGSES